MSEEQIYEVVMTSGLKLRLHAISANHARELAEEQLDADLLRGVSVARVQLVEDAV